ncbi:MAG: putative photosynthetic complex assembly protein PuhE [Marinovum sp.]|nr:putative photosynthetic complex assembly protein PuhE [Marinovum sp.]
MTLAAPWTGALIALFAWWFSTGAILALVRWADGQSAATRLALVVLTMPVFGFGILGFLGALDTLSVEGAYIGFASALALWAWVELAFLTGVIAGPVVTALPEGTPEWERFLRAWGTVAYHEMLLAATMLTLILISWDAANSVGLWTFAILFFARISAKLNLYLGVPRINVEFIPRALAHVPSHFRVAPLNWLFPLSITALSLATMCWIDRAMTSGDLLSPGGVVGFSLLTAITALAALEHWFMVLPLPDAKLWRWMLPKAPTPKTQKIRLGSEDAHGL